MSMNLRPLLTELNWELTQHPVLFYITFKRKYKHEGVDIDSVHDDIRRNLISCKSIDYERLSDYIPTVSSIITITVKQSDTLDSFYKGYCKTALSNHFSDLMATSGPNVFTNCVLKKLERVESCESHGSITTQYVFTIKATKIMI